MAWRLYLLVKADIKLLFFSPWFYVIMGMCVAIVYSFTLIQPRDDLSRVLVSDELDTPSSRSLVRRLSAAGYRTEPVRDFGAACEDVRRDLAYAAVRIDRRGTVTLRVFSIMAEDVMFATLRKVVEDMRFEQYRRLILQEARSWPRLEALPRPFLDQVGEGHDQVATVIVSGIWYLCGITTLVLWILGKDGFAKLKRVYSFAEILVARTIAGCLLGLLLATVFLATAVAFGITFASVPGLVATALSSVVTGVLTGLLLGACAYAAGGTILSLMMIGLLGLTLLFLYLTIVSGIFLPLGGIPQVLNVTSRWLPLFAQLELLRWSAMAGHSLLHPLCLKLLGMLAVIDAVQFALALALLRRA